MKVAIVGAGIGGLTAALALLRVGCEVAIFEQANELAEVGAGLQISPNASRVFAALDLLPQVLAAASEPLALELRDGLSDRRIFSIPAGNAARARYGAPYLHLHRADLQSVLAAALVERAPHALHLGAPLVDYRIVQSGVEAVRGDGRAQSFDLLVGADGLHSTVRKRMLGDLPAHYTGATAWRAVLPRAAAPEIADARNAVVWAGPGRHVVAYALRGGREINLVAVAEVVLETEESWTGAGDPAELRSLFAEFAAPVRRLIAAITTCGRWALHDRDPLARWSDGVVTLLGDACHPMPPFQAQGAAMAIEDAFVLARCIKDGAKGGVPAALALYEARRKPRTSRVLQSARNNGAIFHRSGALTRVATYAPMRIADILVPSVVRSRQDWIYAFDVVT